MLDEMSFLQDIELNDGRLMLFQLPSMLPLASQATAAPPSDALPGTAAAAAAAAAVAPGRAAAPRDVPSSRIGKLLVFESGKVKMQVRLLQSEGRAGVTIELRHCSSQVGAMAGRRTLLSLHGATAEAGTPCCVLLITCQCW